MSAPARLAAVMLGASAAIVNAQDAPAVQSAESRQWEFAATGYWNSVRDGHSYGSGIFIADRGPLHLEARINYEAFHAQSAFVGWTFSFGDDALGLELTPIVGFVGGDVRGAIAGFEATVTAGRFDFYTEVEYVRDRSDKEASYTYAWSELGFRAADWARVGLVGQRTRAYGGEREFQRGGFVQLTKDKVTLGVYWFNPGSRDQVVIGAVGVAF